MSEAKTIRRLDTTVVNLIAAGEIIQRPANALKEIIENSLDAGSSIIQVTVKQGGLKLLQIQDNGSGIKKEDLEIVCERFTTSKLQTFEDLKSIATYGFRGEALASISHVAHVTITTRTSQSKCAYRANYCDGKLKTNVKPCAGNQGTQISVEDLFYNVATRRKMLKSPNEEHALITDVVSRYAIHNAGVAFVLKKYGDSTADVRTPVNSTQVDNIRTIFGSSIAKELINVMGEDKKLGVHFTGQVTSANYSVKKLIFLLFINNRLVESSALRKSIEAVYSAYLPKNSHPFVYISLEISPQNVDVNVHPTKHEVHFLHEDLVIERVQKTLEAKLLGSNSSRLFYTQSLLPGSQAKVSDIITTEKKQQKPEDKVYAHQMIRTDNRVQKLDAFFPQSSTSNKHQNESSRDESSGGSVVDDDRTMMTELIDNDDTAGVLSAGTDSVRQSPATEIVMEGADSGLIKAKASKKRSYQETEDIETPVDIQANDGDKPQRQIRLSSVLLLQKEIKDHCHNGLREILHDHTFVGCVNRERALIQHQTKLYLVNTAKLSQELFYHIMMFEFGKFGVLRLSESAPIYDLALMEIEAKGCDSWSWAGLRQQADISKEEMASSVVDLLKSKSEMLWDYFSIEIDQDGHLCSLPLLLDKYIPDLTYLPDYLVQLATQVNWDNEKECFDSLCKVTSQFYAIKKNWDIKDSLESESDQNWKWVTEHVLYPAIRQTLLPSAKSAQDASVLQIANLTDLYKVFERC